MVAAEGAIAGGGAGKRGTTMTGQQLSLISR